MISTRIAVVVVAILVAMSATAEEPKALGDARRKFDSLQHPTEADRVRYVTRLVRLRESFTRADLAALDAIDAEIIRHPMPVTGDSGEYQNVWWAGGSPLGAPIFITLTARRRQMMILRKTRAGRGALKAIGSSRTTEARRLMGEGSLSF